MKKQNGFSLIEILIVLVIIAILVAVLTPAYQSYIRRGNRSDAIRSVLAMQVNQEKWRLHNTTYTGTVANISPTGTSASIAGYYTLAVSGATGSAYILTATAVVGTTQASDVGCTVFTLTYSAGTTTNTPTICWQ